MQDPTLSSLSRIILIDSISSGNVIDVSLAGGAAISGRNGSGKTSILQLIPIFYGENPSRVISSGRESFINYYIPRTTSYIVFEYIGRDTHPRMVVVYTNPSGTDLNYRFVRAAYQLDYFKKDGVLVNHSALKGNLALSGLSFAPTLIETQREYKRAILGVHTYGNKKTTSSQAYNDYALTKSNQNLEHLEKIVSGMFKRKTNFDDFLSIVVDSVGQDSDASSLHMSLTQKKLKQWRRDNVAYQSVMKLAPKMDIIDDFGRIIQSIEEQMNDVFAQFRSLLGHLSLETQSHHEKAKIEKDTFLENEKQHKAQENQLTLLKVRASHEASVFGGRIKVLKEEAQKYHTDNLEQQALDLADLSNIQHALESDEKRLEALLGSSQNIAKKYEAIKQSEINRHVIFKDEQQKLLLDMQSSLRTDIERMNQEAQIKHDAKIKEHQEERKKLEIEKERASSAHAISLYAIEHPDQDQQAKKEHDLARATLDGLRNEHEIFNKKIRTLDKDYFERKADFERATYTVENAAKNIEKERKIYEEALRSMRPKEGTLLYFLYEKHPFWSDNIARVLRPDVLYRNDLSPESASFENSIFGLSLDLSKLEPHPSSNTQAAEDVIDAARVRFERANERGVQAAAQQKDAASQREKSEQNRATQGLLIQKSEISIQSAQSAINEIKRQIKVKNQDMLKLAFAKAKVTENEFTEANLALVKFDQVLVSDMVQLRNQDNQEREQRVRVFEDHEQAIKNQIASQDTVFNARIEAIENQLHQALSKEGIDPLSLNQIKQNIEEAQKRIHRIKLSEIKVRSWMYWRDHEWIHYDRYQSEFVAQRSNESKYHSETQAACSLFEKKSEKHHQTMKSIQESLGFLHTESEKIRSRLNANHHKYKESTPIPVYNPVWTSGFLVSQIIALEKSLLANTDGLQNAINAISKAFQMHINTPPGDYFIEETKHLGFAETKEWVNCFKAWFSSRHSEVRRIIIEETKDIGGQIHGFHSSMESFDLKVKRFNSELQKNLDASLVFDSITDIELRIVSTVKELDFWPAIQGLSTTYNEWRRADVVGMPSSDLVDAVDRMLNYWDDREGIHVELRQLIRMEGSVIENGHVRKFRKASDLTSISSNGLSYLILATIFVAFINRIRRDARVNIVWALDELRDLDAKNTLALIGMLDKNNITLACAFPDADENIMKLFNNSFQMEQNKIISRLCFKENHV